MPVIRLDFDNEKVSQSDATALSEAVQKIVADITHVEDTFVYANSAQIKVRVAPIEIFIQMIVSKPKDVSRIVKEIRSGLTAWRKESRFPHPINFTFSPMEWKIELGI